MILLVFWLIAFLLAIADQIVMTVIVRREYMNHRSIWEKDGKPRGVFWIPKESMIGKWYVTYSGAHYFRRLTWDWILSTPAWIAKERATHRLLLLHRVLFPAFWICVAGPFAIALLS